MDRRQITIFLIDNDPTALEHVKAIIQSIPEFNIIKVVTSAEEALNLIPQLKPDLICIDYVQPRHKGVELVKAILQHYPVPILVISDLHHSHESREIFDILQAGALDIVPRPSTADPNSEIAKRLIEKIRVLSNVLVMKRHTGKKTSEVSITPVIKGPSHSYDILVVGASMGGPAALQTIFQALPKDFPVPIICIQHISKGFLQSFIDWLKQHCQLSCQIVTEKEKPRPGTIYLSQEGKHIKINAHKELITEPRLPTDRHCPSIDVAMQSIAIHYQAKAMGVLLTGMGEDGAKGMLAIHKAGGMTLAQSEESCIVFGMPKAAIDMGAAQMILDLNQIGPYLLKTFALR